MLKSNTALGVSFELPDTLTVKQLDDYQLGMQKWLTSLNGNPLTFARLNAVAYGVAADAGLISNWQCEKMPLELEDVDQADARIINFVGGAVRAFVEEINEVPFVSPAPQPNTDVP